jgi:hypothetical protein
MRITVPPFDDTDPLRLKVGPWDPFQLYFVSYQARKLCEGMTTTQLMDRARVIAHRLADYIADHLESEKSSLVEHLAERGGWELSYLPPEARNEEGIRHLLENWPSEADDSSPLDAIEDDVSLIDAIIDSNDAVDFAVVALWHVADALRALRKGSDRTSALMDAGEHAVAGMQAACLGEYLNRLQALRLEANAQFADERSRQARQAAHERHRENRDMKRHVWLWCDSNLSGFRSTDAAAEAIAGKIVPVRFRTVRSWISEYKRRHTACSQTEQSTTQKD